MTTVALFGMLLLGFIIGMVVMWAVMSDAETDAYEEGRAFGFNEGVNYKRTNR